MVDSRYIAELFSVNQLEPCSVILVWFCSWPEDRIYSKLDQIFNHLRHESLHFFVRCAEEWIGVNFNKPQSEILVKQEIKAKKFEHILSAIGIHLLTN